MDGIADELDGRGSTRKSQHLDDITLRLHSTVELGKAAEGTLYSNAAAGFTQRVHGMCEVKSAVEVYAICRCTMYLKVDLRS